MKKMEPPPQASAPHSIAVDTPRTFKLPKIVGYVNIVVSLLCLFLTCVPFLESTLGVASIPFSLAFASFSALFLISGLKAIMAKAINASVVLTLSVVGIIFAIITNSLYPLNDAEIYIVLAFAVYAAIFGIIALTKMISDTNTIDNSNAIKNSSTKIVLGERMKAYEKKFGMFGYMTRKINMYVFMIFGSFCLMKGIYHFFKVDSLVGGDAYNLLINRGSVTGAFSAAIACFLIGGIYAVIDLMVVKIQMDQK